MYEAQKFLDTIDLLPYLQPHKSINAVMGAIEDNYEDKQLFNYMCEEEFIEYLSKRYNQIKFYTDTIYRVWG